MIRKDYPTTGVLKLYIDDASYVSVDDQEGLPDYWGIETILWRKFIKKLRKYQEGLPDYWGIETL